MANAKYEEYNGYFNKIRELCIEAYKMDEVSNEAYFIKHGIPEEFMKKIKNFFKDVKKEDRVLRVPLLSFRYTTSQILLN